MLIIWIYCGNPLVKEKEVLTSASSSDYDTVTERNGDGRRQGKGQDNTKPTDENYFTKSYLEKLKHEWICMNGFAIGASNIERKIRHDNTLQI